MFHCTDCNNDFTDTSAVEKTYYDIVEFWGAKVQMPYTIGICPYCGSEDIKEAEIEEDNCY